MEFCHRHFVIPKGGGGGTISPCAPVTGTAPHDIISRLSCFVAPTPHPLPCPCSLQHYFRVAAGSRATWNYVIVPTGHAVEAAARGLYR